jgi:regulator of sigma D
MNTATENTPHDRRARTRKEIKQLITERNSVLSQYYNLASHTDESINNEDSETVLEMLQEFCQDLVDYMATGHFEIYRRIEDGEERRDDMIELANEIFPKITATTEIAIDFNDLYDTSKDFNKEVLKDLSRQLTTLGEQLATRIDLEDKFINTLLATKPPQATFS